MFHPGVLSELLRKIIRHLIKIDAFDRVLNPVPPKSSEMLPFLMSHYLTYVHSCFALNVTM